MDSNRKIYCNLITSDSILIKRLEINRDIQKGLLLKISNKPFLLPEIDVWVLPFSELTQDLIEYKILTEKTVICYGPDSVISETFHSGCDDFLREPILISEILIRILKNIKTESYLITENGRISIEPFKILFNDESENLTHGEFIILRKLVEQKNRVVFKNVLKAILNLEMSNHSRTIDVQISNIRKKITKISRNSNIHLLIKAVKNVGYYLETE